MNNSQSDAFSNIVCQHFSECIPGTEGFGLGTFEDAVKRFREQCGERIAILLCGTTVFEGLREHPEFVEGFCGDPHLFYDVKVYVQPALEEHWATLDQYGVILRVGKLVKKAESER